MLSIEYMTVVFDQDQHFSIVYRYCWKYKPHTKSISDYFNLDFTPSRTFYEENSFHKTDNKKVFHMMLT